jgi:xylulokinase
MNVLLGIDLGTTSLKVSLYSETGLRIGSQSREYPIQVPQPGFAEQDPLDWWNAFVNCCQQLKADYPEAFEQIAGIGICGQMHSQVYLDQHDQILRPAISWMDQRTASIAERYNGMLPSRI